MWRDVLHTFVADKLPEESLVTQMDVCVLDLVSALFVYCGERAEGVEQELAMLLADLRSFSRNGVEVLVGPWRQHHPGRGGIPRRAEFPKGLARDRLAQCLKPEMFHVWREASTCTS